jgi:hypothetical protein
MNKKLFLGLIISSIIITNTYTMSSQVVRTAVTGAIGTGFTSVAYAQIPQTDAQTNEPENLLEDVQEDTTTVPVIDTQDEQTQIIENFRDGSQEGLFQRGRNYCGGLLALASFSARGFANGTVIRFSTHLERTSVVAAAGFAAGAAAGDLLGSVSLNSNGRCSWTRGSLALLGGLIGGAAGTRIENPFGIAGLALGGLTLYGAQRYISSQDEKMKKLCENLTLKEQEVGSLKTALEVCPNIAQLSEAQKIAQLAQVEQDRLLQELKSVTALYETNRKDIYSLSKEYADSLLELQRSEKESVLGLKVKLEDSYKEYQVLLDSMQTKVQGTEEEKVYILQTKSAELITKQDLITELKQQLLEVETHNEQYLIKERQVIEEQGKTLKQQATAIKILADKLKASQKQVIDSDLSIQKLTDERKFAQSDIERELRKVKEREKEISRLQEKLTSTQYILTKTRKDCIYKLGISAEQQVELQELSDVSSALADELEFQVKGLKKELTQKEFILKVNQDVVKELQAKIDREKGIDYVLGYDISGRYEEENYSEILKERPLSPCDYDLREALENAVSVRSSFAQSSPAGIEATRIPGPCGSSRSERRPQSSSQASSDSVKTID